jgi:hypothetical protein
MRSKFAVATFALAITLMAGTPLAHADNFCLSTRPRPICPQVRHDGLPYDAANLEFDKNQEQVKWVFNEIFSPGVVSKFSIVSDFGPLNLNNCLSGGGDRCAWIWTGNTETLIAGQFPHPDEEGFMNAVLQDTARRGPITDCARGDIQIQFTCDLGIVHQYDTSITAIYSAKTGGFIEGFDHGGFPRDATEITFPAGEPPTDTPEPSSLLLLGTAVLGLGYFGRKRSA